MRLRPLSLAAALVMVAGGVFAASSTAATKQVHRHWQFASAAAASVHPGMQTFTGDNQCTANFVFTSADAVYLGQAAHCAGTDGNTATDGCTAHSMPLGTEVQDIDGNRIGELAYSSWLTMQAVGETDPNACAYNDLGLIRLDDDVISLTNPSVPVFGGPTGLRTGQFTPFAQIFGYGNSNLRMGLLLPRRGFVIQEDGGGWGHETYTLTPGIPGDSGSPLLDTNGRAAGILSTLMLTPHPLASTYSDLASDLAYAAAHGSSVSLVPGDVAFHHDLPSTLE